MTAATFAATLYAAHTLADHVLGQTDRQAAAKAAPGRAGRGALAAHVGQYHAVVATMVAAAWAVLDLPLSASGVLAGAAVSIATHALFDRRRPVRWLLERTGSPAFTRLADHGLNGPQLADQALHTASLWAAALITAALST